MVFPFVKFIDSPADSLVQSQQLLGGHAFNAHGLQAPVG
jgi:hypothetical protein